MVKERRTRLEDPPKECEWDGINPCSESATNWVRFAGPDYRYYCSDHAYEASKLKGYEAQGTI